LKYETLKHAARYIDHLIDDNLPKRGAVFLSQENIKNLVLGYFKDFYVESCGWHKIVFGIHSADHKLVLKVGPKRSIEQDHEAYKRVPKSVRHRLFAKVYWHTKYCLLQEYGYPVRVSEQQLFEIRRMVYKYGIFDVKAANLKRVDGEIKIVDANVTWLRFSMVLRKIDEIKPRLPKKLITLAKKLTKKLYD
jgi:hypothetical protein